MDPVALAYYALVCALLAALAPAVPPLSLRVLIGAAVGIGAAAGLPALKALAGL